MIQARHIDKSFGTLRVLKDVCFTAAPAEVVSIVGASGAGKSTLLQILGSLSRPDKGSVTIDGTDIFSLSDKGFAILKARVPLAELYRYSTTLSSITSGSATFTMEFADYQPVPGDVQNKLLADYAAQEEED